MPPKQIPIPQMYSLPIQSPQTITNRAQMLRDIESGELEAIEFDARTFKHGVKNRNHFTFLASDLPSFAPSFANKPFLRDHNTRSISARDGIILSSKLVGDEFHQRIRITTRTGMSDYVEGRIDRFSIGWDSDWIMCTVCNSDWLSCTHWPGRKYQTDRGEVTCELCWMGPVGKETSAVNSNAVDGTGLLAALETVKIHALQGGTMKIKVYRDGQLIEIDESEVLETDQRVVPTSSQRVPRVDGARVLENMRANDAQHRGYKDPALITAEEALEQAEQRLATDESNHRADEETQLSRQRRTVENLLGAEQNAAALAANVERSNTMLLTILARVLSTSLHASKLPAPSQAQIRKRFQARLDDGSGFEPAELDDEIVQMRAMLGEVMAGAMIQGPGRVNAMFNTDDAIQAAAADMFRVDRPDQLKSVKPARLSGIRELYHTLTGDYGMHGGFYPDEVGLSTTLDFTGLVKNALNKLVDRGWEQMGVSGYDWWEKVVSIEPFNSLQQVTGVIIGTVGSLPTVEERGEYTELLVGDSPETGDWSKYGGYVPLTLELIDRDETRKVVAYGLELGKASKRNISEQVAGIFTQNSAAGPVMADGGALFNNTAVTTAGGHANLLTTALGTNYDAWKAASNAMYKQTMFTHADDLGGGKRQAVRPKFCPVPVDLFDQAADLFVSRDTYEALPANYYGKVTPLPVPEWTDATDWAAVADPNVAPAIIVGHRFGLKPEIYTAGRDTDPAVFMNDEHRIKVRHFLVIFVVDFRPLHKNNVAG